MYMAGVHLLFIFHSTLHSSQSSRFRFKSHPAATKPATCQKHKLIPENAQKTITNLCVFTFEKWAENIVDHIVTFMHQVPVAFRGEKMCNVEQKKDFCWWTEIRSRKGIRCSAGAPLEGWERNMRRSHSAWHITLISSWTEASGPRQTHTAPVEEDRFNFRTTECRYSHYSSVEVDIKGVPFFTPNRKGLLLNFRADLSSSELQNKTKAYD